MSAKPSESSSTGLSPCQVIAGSTTSGRGRSIARLRWGSPPPPAATARWSPARTRTRYTPVVSVFGIPTWKRPPTLLAAAQQLGIAEPRKRVVERAVDRAHLEPAREPGRNHAERAPRSVKLRTVTPVPGRAVRARGSPRAPPPGCRRGRAP